MMAPSFIMVLCLLVCRLAEVRLRACLAETQQTIPDQAHCTPHNAALVFQCFEGIELLHVQTDAASLTIVLRLQPLHRLILALLGPLYKQIYNPSG
jgi:transposase